MYPAQDINKWLGHYNNVVGDVRSADNYYSEPYLSPCFDLSLDSFGSYSSALRSMPYAQVPTTLKEVEDRVGVMVKYI